MPVAVAWTKSSDKSVSQVLKLEGERALGTDSVGLNIAEFSDLQQQQQERQQLQHEEHQRGGKRKRRQGFISLFSCLRSCTQVEKNRSKRTISEDSSEVLNSPTCSIGSGLSSPSPSNNKQPVIDQYLSTNRLKARDTNGVLVENLDKMGDEDEKIQVVHQLSRGGTIVMTKLGPIQFGCPPETIKDSMVLGLGIPSFFIIPKERFVKKFGPSQGVNVAEFEFPAYCNFFFKGKRVWLVVDDEEVKQRIKNVFQETLLGPLEIDPDEDFDESYPRDRRPDLSKELGFFRKFGDKLMNVDMLLSFAVFDPKTNSVKLEVDGGSDFVTVQQTASEYIVLDTLGAELARVPLEVTIPTEKTQIAPSLANAPIHFEPPLFGVTVLGSSHGFDPKGKTSGYVLWMNRRGIMIDPPPNSNSVLQANHIAPSLIDAVIVTHCHADHDAGTFQKILQEGKVTLMTTPTIFGSFIRKYAGLSGLEKSFLETVLEFRPVRIGEPVKIRGGVLKFFYSLHSIPCVGFEAFFGGKSIVFSADHMNDPARIKTLFEDGVLSAGRRDSLLEFPWHHDLILHEAGVPPIHTPMETLEALPEDVKSRMLVVHVALDKIPEGSGLRAAIPGVENTVVIENVEEPQHAKALETLDLLSSIPVFQQLTLKHASDVLSFSKVMHFGPGEPIISKGEVGTCFYAIMSGQAQVRVEKSGTHLSPRSNRSESAESVASYASTDSTAAHHTSDVTVKTYFAGDYFGEQALLKAGSVRTADIVAVGDVRCLRFDRSDFVTLIKGTGIMENFAHLASMRNAGTWDVMDCNSTLKNLSASQKTQLEIHFEAKDFKKGEKIWSKGTPVDLAAIVQDGSLRSSIYLGGASQAPHSTMQLLEPPHSAPQEDSKAAEEESQQPQACAEDETGLVFERGALIVDTDNLIAGGIHDSDLVAETDATVLLLPKKALIEKIFTNNPGLMLALMKERYVL